MATVPICFIDTETTSLDPRTREPWEIAIIRREPDGTEKRWAEYVEVGRLDLADPMSLKIGKFYERYPLFTDETRVIGEGATRRPVKRYPISRQAAAAEVEKLTRGAHINGAVPSFDCDTLQRLLWSCGSIPAWHYHLIDVESYAAGLLGLEPPYSHDAILAQFGITYDEAKRHTAMGDAEMDMALYDAVRTAAADIRL